MSHFRRATIHGRNTRQPDGLATRLNRTLRSAVHERDVAAQSPLHLKDVLLGDIGPIVSADSPRRAANRPRDASRSAASSWQIEK